MNTHMPDVFMDSLLSRRSWESAMSIVSISNELLSRKSNKKDESSLHVRNWHADKQHVQCPQNKRKKKFCSVSRTSVLAMPKEHTELRVIQRDPTKVKLGALLYEISERTNALAKPRIPKINTSSRELNKSIDLAKLPEASPRLLELSRPKVNYSPPPRPVGYVERSALTAVATPRLIQLSKPRKRRTPRPPKKRRLRRRNCSPRITHLARPKCSVGKRIVHGLFERPGNSQGRKWWSCSWKVRSADGKLQKRKRISKKGRTVHVTDSTRSVILVNMISKTGNKKKGLNSKKRRLKTVPTTSNFRGNEYRALNTHRK
ncbi:uncharacterized protein LOC107274978 isoform X2 [Cephus cinctus]|uniref:Uncharacterized protein LOC107274978 isoform X2 n=1 Tax=Cephus cinctus TaxID=211228 RepID=A0AAJ7RB38_CEPCN|nr:uncharacterized protein LOC107274978 isoform X2 [Cephus cinctus]